jgi:choline dehydrogenase
VFAVPVEGAPGPFEPQYQLGAKWTSSSGPTNDMLLSMMNSWDLTTSPDFQAVVGGDSALVLTCGVHEPRSRGQVTLDAADPDVQPRIELNLLAEQADVDRIVEGIRRCVAVLRTEPMQAFARGLALLSEADLDDDDAVAAYARSMVAGWYHPVGTCRMGPERGGAVVDDLLRVHGVDRLRVVDASVVPRIPRSPTNLTAIAVAERAAELFEAG